MKADTWHRARHLFEEALELRPDEWESFLEERCDDDLVREETSRLLQAHARWGERLEPLHRPARASSEHDLTGGQVVAGYELVRKLGVGGMGAVWEAEQSSPRRRVALKLLRSSLTSSETRRRFEEEARMLARLRHPAVAQVYGAGVAEVGRVEQPWIALELIEGARDLKAFVLGEGLSLEDSVTLLASVADGIHHGHERGVLHRDVKPENVLVDAEGRAKVIDFGVAKAVDEAAAEQPRATQAGEIIGTLSTMSPEQLAGDPDLVDTRSDVYGLGATAFEVLCGQPPHDVAGLSVPRAIRRLEEKPPRRPRTLRPDLPIDLENVLLRALERDPDRRYPSAAAFAEDLRRFIRHEPVTASPPSLVHQLRLLARRYRAATAIAGVSAALVIASLVAVLVLWLRAAREVSKSRAVNDFFAFVLGTAAPDVIGRDATVYEALEIAAPMIDDDFASWPDVREALHTTLGRTLDALGRAEAARTHLNAALDLARANHGTDSEQALESQVQLGVNLSRSSEGLVAAVALLEDVYRAARDTTGPDARVTLRARHALAWAREELEGGDRLANELEQVLTALQPRLDATDPFVATVRNDLAVHLHRRGDLERAEELYREALDLLEAESHVGALDVRLNLAPLLFEAGRTSEALELMRETHRSVIRTLSPSHGLATRAALGLAQMELGSGNTERARALLEEVANARTAAGVPTGRFDADTTELLATIAHTEGDEHEAARLFETLVRQRTASLGEHHLLTLRARHNEAMSLLILGETASAIQLLEELYLAKCDALGDDDPSTIATLQGMGEAVQRSGDSTGALRLFQQARESYARSLGESDPRTLTSRLYAAQILSARGELELAEEELTEILDSLPRGHAGQAAIVRASAHEAMARNLARMSLDDEAMAEGRAALEAARDGLAEGHPVRVRIEDSWAGTVSR